MFDTVLLGSLILLPLGTKDTGTNKSQTDKATFAGGCFWCMTQPFDTLPGVIAVLSGYIGGHIVNPTYEDVTSERSGHREAIEITFNPDIISYDVLLDKFWRQIDPTDAGGQFADRGPSYKTAIFYHNDAQKNLAEVSRRKIAESGRFNKPIATEILPAAVFYPAEDYHQDFARKNQTHYKRYRFFSGRDSFLSAVWDKEGRKRAQGKEAANQVAQPMTREELKNKLTPLQFKVTQDNGTEPAFQNEFWDNHREGIYVDIVSGEALFSSLDKFESGTGWPSFTRPLEAGNIVEKTDRSFFMTRTEVRSKHAGSHLGHLFNDGPQPTGLRYCMNSAALRFIPREDLEKEGYGRYLVLFAASAGARHHR